MIEMEQNIVHPLKILKNKNPNQISVGKNTQIIKKCQSVGDRRDVKRLNSEKNLCESQFLPAFINATLEVLVPGQGIGVKIGECLL